ncbi:LOW QUALITY PROTEIN: AMP deaminase 2-like [Paramacrobiotus metropolitanus]|uniref:LOW QUALITY PROTEIN: AMP deaminase 2-like n=1 Tax=Paramacrobiotus metropolitanus TaxID=2943436 RepID=UPI00244589B6|nr:LOW QUALITY PROTEIN: AMP deaminase 2-like [Paramacrobiotus metropolitanus]
MAENLINHNDISLSASPSPTIDILINDRSTFANWINSANSPVPASSPIPIANYHNTNMNGYFPDQVASMDSFETAPGRNNNIGFYVGPHTPQRQLSSSSLDLLSLSENRTGATADAALIGSPTVRTKNSNASSESSARIDTSIAAPYEFAQAPIERTEEDRQIQHQLSQAFINLKEGKLSRRASSELLDQRDGGGSVSASYSRNLDPNAPDYQRVAISGFDDLHIAKELAACDDLVRCAQEIAEALDIRRRYMRIAGQYFPPTVDRYLEAYRNHRRSPKPAAREMEFRKTIQDHPIHPPTFHGKFYSHPVPEPSEHIFRMVKGCYEVYPSQKHVDSGDKPTHFGIDRNLFWRDYSIMWYMILDGPLKSFCFRKLSFLESKFLLHANLNENREMAAQKMVPHRDFYNIRKVDNHIHASSCMNQKHLLRFIKRQMRINADTPVMIDKKTGRPMTLSEVFQSMNLTTYDLNVDRLDVHADRNTFHRFDKFNTKYNPIGQSMLRDIFIKTDNYIKGKFFAEILKEVMADLEESKYQNAELRLSIYGRSIDEWDKLGKWAVDHGVWSPNVMWMIQIPRLYDVYKENKLVNCFADVLRNIFQPLFEATAYPERHPELHQFLHHVVSFDSVDDESKTEHIAFSMNVPTPEEWTMDENPPYTYYLFYMYSNMVALNNFRRERGMNTFTLRPHSGEAGPVNHLISGFILGESIAHGLMLRKVPVLQYLFYLAQIGIAMSPLSNNSLFLDYHRNPLRDYFVRGLNVALSTDDPLQFHFTKEPLMEEYSIAAQIWKLSATDLCELAKNSVLQSGFSDIVKQHWLGPNFKAEGVQGNDISRTNVPDVRVAYRYETLLDELTNVFEAVYNDNV